MSLKCEECGLVGWVGETSCSRCGAELTAKSASGIYSGSRQKRGQTNSQHSRIRPFFKALLYSFVIEFVVLLITAGPLGDSFMRHSGGASRSGLSDLLAFLGFMFHYPALLISFYFETIILAPLIQIGFMTAILTLIFRWRRSKDKDQRRILPI